MNIEEAANRPTGILADIHAKLDMLERLGVAVMRVNNPPQDRAGKIYGGSTNIPMTAARLWVGQSAAQLDLTLEAIIWRLGAPPHCRAAKAKPDRWVTVNQLDIDGIPAEKLIGDCLD